MPKIRPTGHNEPGMATSLSRRSHGTSQLKSLPLVAKGLRCRVLYSQGSHVEFQTVYNVLLGIATAIIGFLGGFVIKSFQRSIEDVDTRTRHIEVMVAQDYMSAADFKAFRAELKEDHKEFRTELITAIAQMRAEIKSDNLRLQNQIQSKADK